MTFSLAAIHHRTPPRSIPRIMEAEAPGMQSATVRSSSCSTATNFLTTSHPQSPILSTLSKSSTSLTQRYVEYRTILISDSSVYRVCSRMNLECQFVFASPSIPNVTIISIQPQQGPPGELVIIELWILLYWALRLAKRVNGYTSFPVSLTLPSRARDKH